MITREVKLTKWGNSNGIRISKEDLAELGYVSGSVVFDMTIKNGQIILVPKEKIPQTIEELFETYDSGPFDTTEWETGGPVGEEII